MVDTLQNSVYIINVSNKSNEVTTMTANYWEDIMTVATADLKKIFIELPEHYWHEDTLMVWANHITAKYGFEKSAVTSLYVAACNELIADGFWEDCELGEKDNFLKKQQIKSQPFKLLNTSCIVEEEQSINGFETNEVRFNQVALANFDGVEYHIYEEIYRTDNRKSPCHVRTVYAPFCSIT